MKPNVVDRDMTHNRSDLAKRSRAIESLAHDILPCAVLLVRQGIGRHMSQIASEVFVEEAEAMLQSLVGELGELGGIDDGMRARLDSSAHGAGNAAAGRANAQDDDAQDDGWVVRLGQDFALAAAAFWLEESDLDAAVRRSGSRAEDFELIASRFHVLDGRRLLEHIAARSQQHVVTTNSLAGPAKDRRASGRRRNFPW